MDWADIESVVTERLTNEEYNGLLTAVNTDYFKKEKRLAEIEAEVRKFGQDVEALFGEFEDLHMDQMATRQLAWFQLGYAAAVRLLGWPPDVEVVDGGIRTPPS